MGTPLGPISVVDSQEAPDGQWAEVVGSYEPQSGEARLYVDGELRASRVLQARMLGNPSGPLWIGGGGASRGTRPFSGRVSEAGVYSEALSDVQVKSLNQGNGLEGAAGENQEGGGFPSWAIIALSGGGFVMCILLATVLLVVVRRGLPKTPRWTPRTKLRQNSHASRPGSSAMRVGVEDPELQTTPEPSTSRGDATLRQIGSKIAGMFGGEAAAESSLKVPLSPSRSNASLASHPPGAAGGIPRTVT